MSRGGVNYIPRPDGAFGGWSDQFVKVVEIWWAAQGQKPNELDPLKEALAAWKLAYPAHIAAQAAAEAARQTKDAARVSLEAEIRPIARFVQSYFATTDADRANMGITVRDGALTPAAPPTTRPLVRIDTSQRLLHTLRFSDESTPTRRRKPHGVLGAEVWVAIAAPHDPPPLIGAAFRFLSVNPRGTLQTDFTTAEAGKTAYYALRWLSTRGETGPWSEIAAATVAA